MKNDRTIDYFLLTYGIVSIAILHPIAHYYGDFFNLFRIGFPEGTSFGFLFFLGTGSIATILGAYGVIATAFRMEMQERSERHWIKVVRWTARTISLLYVPLTLSIFTAHQLIRYYPRAEPMPIVPLVLGAFMLIGLGLAWKWEFFGALISLIAFIGITIVNAHVLRESTLYIVPTTAVLFLLCWWSSRSPDQPKEM